jgi:hypothetical protein
VCCGQLETSALMPICRLERSLPILVSPGALLLRWKGCLHFLAPDLIMMVHIQPKSMAGDKPSPRYSSPLVYLVLTRMRRIVQGESASSPQTTRLT